MVGAALSLLLSLAATATVPVVADSIEIEVRASGQIDTDAQAYRVTATVFGEGADAQKDAESAVRGARERLLETGVAEKDVTELPRQKLGFVGNESYLPDVEFEGSSVPAGEIPFPIALSAIAPDRPTAERVFTAFRGVGVRSVSAPEAILLDKVAAVRAARMAALVHAEEIIQSYQADLKFKRTEIVAIDDTMGPFDASEIVQLMQSFSEMRDNQPPAPEHVRTRVTSTVKFRLMR